MRLNREAVDLDWRSDELFFECRAALGLSRPVRLATHRAIASPVVIGGIRPCILVPPDWDAWPAAHRRASLLHELAHLARGDDWAKLGQELISPVFFFHPLVHWLLGRLDRERELLCDEVVVALRNGAGATHGCFWSWPNGPGGSGLRPAGVRPALLPFLDRRTVAIRISRLLEDDMLTTLSQRSARRSLILGSLAVAVALGLTGVRVRAVETAGKTREKCGGDDPVQGGAERSRKIEGVILDPDGKPVIGATVVGGIDETGNRNHQVFQTDQNGRFEWSIPERPVLIYFVAYKKGFSPAFWMEWMDHRLARRPRRKQARQAAGLSRRCSLTTREAPSPARTCKSR